MTDALVHRARPVHAAASVSPSTGQPPLAGHTALSRKLLSGAAVFWFVVAAGGQAVFVLYILLLYGASLVSGDLARWSRVMPNGLVSGDTIGNATMIAHVMIAAVVMLAGALQLVPALRSRFPRFHHWNGRVYLLTAVVASLSGLWMVWARTEIGSLIQHIGTSINGLLVLVAAALVLRHAMGRRMAAHRRWALRLFMIVNGVWFFRVGLMFWVAVNGGPVGFDPATFRGPVLELFTFLQYLLPLAMLQAYFVAQERASPTLRYAVAAMLVISTVAMAIGIGVATLGMWLPHM